jgi:hypothetical protein
MPALVGGAYSFHNHGPQFSDFILIIIGLVCAEVLNLLGYDYSYYRNRGSDSEKQNPMLPGNPVAPGHLLSAKGIPFAMGAVGIIGASVLLYFTISVGIPILIFLLIAFAIGALYLFPPFPYAYLSTSLLPPILTGGVCLALTGKVDFTAFLIGLPITWIAVAVILTYRVAYPGERPLSQYNAMIVLGFYLLSLVNILGFSLLHIYPPLALTTLTAIPAGSFFVFKVFKTEKENSIPATTLGVLIHFFVCLLISGSLLYG